MGFPVRISTSALVGMTTVHIEDGEDGTGGIDTDMASTQSLQSMPTIPGVLRDGIPMGLVDTTLSITGITHTILTVIIITTMSTVLHRFTTHMV